MFGRICTVLLAEIYDKALSMERGNQSKYVEIETSHSINKAIVGNTIYVHWQYIVDNERIHNARKDF